MSTFTTLRDRDAWNTIRGYVYQVDLTVERWLSLQHGQTLELERGEDIDIVSRSLTPTSEEGERLLEQVKHRENSITLKSPEALTAIACFIEHCQTNPSTNLLFLFTTNTQVGKEKHSPMPNKTPAIEAWEKIRQGSLQKTGQNAALQGIRTILKNVTQPAKLHGDTWQIFRNFITNASDDQLLDLICSFEWSTKAPDAQSLSPSLQNLLIDRKHAKDDIEAQEQYRRLFLYVFKLLCKPGIKQLTVEERSHQLSLPTLSETDHQLLNNFGVWVQALEVRLGVLEQHLDREVTEPYLGEGVADCVEQLLQDYTKLFVGRETTVKKLDEFLSQKCTRVLTLIAPAGFGKTALLANWVASRKGDGCFVLYHFFSQRYDVTRSFTAAYRNLLRQLYDYYELSAQQLHNNEDWLRDQLYRLIKEYSEQNGRPLVIVLDALDEADPPFKQFLPLLPENVFLIASARAEEGQEPEYLRSWTDNTLSIRIDRLCREAIAQWLRKTPELAAFAEDSYFVAQLDEITQGFPLYLRYLTEELIQAQQKGEDVPVVLTRSPKGFGAYVQEQFKLLAQVEEIRRNREVQELFALLSVALGVLSEDDIQELTDLNEWDLAAFPWQATRWFSIQTGFYSFAHPLLAQEFQGVLKRQASSAKDKLIKYCSRWEEHPSHYALRHYPEHLRDVKQWEELYAIARNEDFAITQQEHLPDEPDLPLKTVQTALLSAGDRDNAGAMAEFLLLHARRVGQTTAQESPLDALRSGSLDRALALADLYEPERCVLWYLLLVWELKDSERLEAAQAALKQLQNKKLPRLSEWWEGDYGAYLLVQIFDISEETFTNLCNLLLEDNNQHGLCHHLVAYGYFSKALKVIGKMNSNLEQAELLEAVVVAQAQAGKLVEAYQAAQEIRGKLTWDEFYWDRAIKAIAIAYAQAGDLAPALEKAQEIRGDCKKAEALVEIVKALAQTSDFKTAIETRRQTHWRQAFVLVEIAKVQAQTDLQEAANLALELVVQIEDASEKDEVRRAIAIAQLSKLDQAFKIAQEINSKVLRAWALLAIADEQVEASKYETARTAIAIALGMKDRIGEENQRVFKQVIIAVMLAEAGKFEAAREKTQAIRNKAKKIGAMKSIAHVQMQAGQKDKALANLTDALAIARSMKNKEPIVLALKVVAVAFAKAGKITAAIEITREIFDEVTQAETLKSIAIIQVQAGNFDKALETVHKIDREQTPGEAFLLAKTTVLARMKKFDAALDTAKEMANKFTWSDAMCQIAVSRAQAREFDAALNTVEKINKENQQATVLGYIAAEQAKAGDIKAAQSTFNKALGKARQAGQELERAIALEAIAEAQVAAGFAFHAVKTAETILINRSEHLPAIAHAFVETGDQANFKKLLIPCAYYLDAVYQMCRYLARLYPEKAEEIAKVLSELN